MFLSVRTSARISGSGSPLQLRSVTVIPAEEVNIGASIIEWSTVTAKGMLARRTGHVTQLRIESEKPTGSLSFVCEDDFQ